MYVPVSGVSDFLCAGHLVECLVRSWRNSAEPIAVGDRKLVHRRHRRTGHLLQGRYKAILVDSEAYLLELARYVVLNPVRAQEKIRQAAFECPRCARRRESCGLSRRHDEGASGGHGQRLAHRAWGSVEIISAGLQGFASVVEDEEAL